ncbi:MAG: hypothetical protein ABFS05_10570 [Bacteroidota bacterium]
MEQQQSSSNAQLIAIVSYLTFIGWIIAFVLYQNDKSELASCHIRQSLGLFILGIILFWIPVLGWILSLVVLVLWIIGLIYAAQGEAKPIPIVGQFFLDLFKGLQ